MKKFCRPLKLLILPVLLAHATLAFPQQENILNIYNWSDYIDPETISAFEEEYDIKVNYDIYDNSEIVDTKLLAGRSGYDLIFHGASFASRLVAIGVFQPLDKAKLSNWKNLDPKILAAIDEFDPGNRFGMPYMWGTTGVAYNADIIEAIMPDAPVDSTPWTSLMSGLANMKSSNSCSFKSPSSNRP